MFRAIWLVAIEVPIALLKVLLEIAKVPPRSNLLFAIGLQFARARNTLPIRSVANTTSTYGSFFKTALATTHGRVRGNLQIAAHF